MSDPRPSIEVHIEELILHGAAPGSRWDVADALERELRELLGQRGVPTAWSSNPERIQAGTVRANFQTGPTAAGAEIARAAYRGGEP
jgi:hypothetical protein